MSLGRLPLAGLPCSLTSLNHEGTAWSWQHLGVHSSRFTETKSQWPSAVSTEQVTRSSCHQCLKLGRCCSPGVPSKSSYCLSSTWSECAFWVLCRFPGGKQQQRLVPGSRMWSETAHRKIAGDWVWRTRTSVSERLGFESCHSLLPDEIPWLGHWIWASIFLICQVGMMIPTSQGELNNRTTMFHKCDTVTNDNDDFKINFTTYL